MPNPVTILLVEDSPDDEALTVLALRERTAANIEVAHDSQEAIDDLVNDNKDLRLVLLDLNLPKVDGLRCCGASAKTSAQPDAGGHPDELKRAR